jgi:hypothetical protein
MSALLTTADLHHWIQDQIKEVEQKLGDDIIHIRYSFGTNWNGYPAIYFRTLLPDAVADNDDRLGDVGRRVRRELAERWNLLDWDRTPYFNFRSQSEQAELKDPEWD